MSLKESNLRFAVVKSIVDALSDELDKMRAGHTVDLLERYDDEGTKSFTVRLPDGSQVANISLAVPKDKIEVTDEGVFNEWLEANHPGVVSTEVIPGEPERTVVIPATEDQLVVTVDPKGMTEVMKHFEAQDGTVVDTATGVVVAGVANVPGGRPKSFSVRYETGGRDKIAAAWRAGALNGVTGGGILPAIEAPVIERQLVVVEAERDEFGLNRPYGEEPLEPETPADDAVVESQRIRPTPQDEFDPGDFGDDPQYQTGGW